MPILDWFVRRVASQAALVVLVPLCIGLLIPGSVEAQHSASGHLRGTVSDSLRQQLAGARIRLLELSLVTPTRGLCGTRRARELHPHRVQGYGARSDRSPRPPT